MKTHSGQFAALLRKNLKAFITARGYEVACLRPAGASRIQTRLVKAGQPPVAAAPVGRPLQPRKYFTLQIEARPGINHLRFALELLVREAVALNRTPIVFKPQFDPRHNLGHDLDVDWDKYIDLAQIRLVDTASGAVTTIQALRPEQVPGLDRLSAAWFERTHRVSAADNARFDLIVRRNKTGLHVDGVHDAYAALPGIAVRFAPSPLVLQLFREVQAQLGSYAAMHVRRDDMLAMTEQYPNLDRDTQPARILQTLAPHLPPRSVLYVMTNERDKAFFGPLQQVYRVFQYFDFAALRTLIDSHGANNAPDNFLLFEVEKLLFEHAAAKVHTFTHPEGGKRIALTSDKGWA